MQRNDDLTAWLPELLYTGGRFHSGLALISDCAGRITDITSDYKSLAERVVHLGGRALLPGLVNAHSHAFQRVIRGRTELRSAAHDSFWTWREMMYNAAARLTPEGIYDASRMAFLEMSLSGITSVGEFHYLHHAPDGTPYAEANELSKHVIRAARDVGLRIALLRVAYARSGFQTPTNERQTRFIERDAQRFLQNVDQLRSDFNDNSNSNNAKAPDSLESVPHAWIGVAPHSVRAVPLAYLREVGAYAARHALPVHMHVAEQPAEVASCLAEHGRTPVALLEDEGLLNERFTAVHAVHITPGEASALARRRAHVCACPTTERNLGDGIIPADILFAEGAHIALGTDSHTQIDLLEDARELEYHLRLQKLERAVLASNSERRATQDEPAVDHDQMSSLAARLFHCATVSGAHSIGATGGELSINSPADFFTVDLNDPSIAGASTDDLLPSIVFSLARTAIRETVVGGEVIVEDGKHRAGAEIVQKFVKVQKRLWE